MKVVVAPNALKGSLSAPDAAKALAAGWLDVYPETEIVEVPVSDGGDGFALSLAAATGGRMVAADVSGPLGAPVRAHFGLLGDGRTGVIEMALASGLALMPEGRLDPTITTTYGTGELIRAALDAGCTNLLVGIGGSATNDGGVGMAQALGVRFLDAQGNEVQRGGGHLTEIERVDLSGIDSRLCGATVRVACDVDNPLTGPRGATAIYGPQKGATSQQVALLDAGLAHLAEVIRRDLVREIEVLPGAGAAGGLGGGLVAFLGATLQSGIELVIEAVKLDDKMSGADLAITAEGRIDSQTLSGKAPYGVSLVARRHGVPIVAFAGSMADTEQLVPEAFDALVGVVPGPQSLAEAMAQAGENLRTSAARAARLMAIGRSLAAEHCR